MKVIRYAIKYRDGSGWIGAESATANGMELHGRAIRARRLVTSNREAAHAIARGPTTAGQVIVVSFACDAVYLTHDERSRGVALCEARAWRVARRVNGHT